MGRLGTLSTIFAFAMASFQFHVKTEDVTKTALMEKFKEMEKIHSFLQNRIERLEKKHGKTKAIWYYGLCYG